MKCLPIGLTAYWLVAFFFSIGAEGKPLTSQELVVSKPQSITSITLASLDQNEKPWENIPAFEERPYVYLGPSALELATGSAPKTRPEITDRLKEMGDRFFPQIQQQLKISEVEFETWPTLDDWGLVTWNISRYRKNESDEWKWLDASLWNKPDGDSDPTEPVFTKVLDPRLPEDFDKLFNNIPAGLYDRPIFGAAVWTTKDGKQAYGGWLDSSDLATAGTDLKNSGLLAHIVFPPARFNGKPKSFVVQVTSGAVIWPGEISWTSEVKRRLSSQKYSPIFTKWPHDFEPRYLEHVQRASGEIPVHTPSGKVIDFRKMGSGQPDHHIVEYLEYLKTEHYEKKIKSKIPGLSIELDHFMWQKIPEANLIVKIPGTLPRDKNRPIIFVDHVDKAIAEDHYAKTNEKITTGGADDNGTATAAELMASEIYAERYLEKPPAHDIWLFHITGEEYPGSSLGARHQVGRMLKQGQMITGVIDMDMLGHHPEHSKRFQINPGPTAGSWKIAQAILNASQIHAARWTPIVRLPYSRKGYDTQTDGEVFRLVGYDHVTSNEDKGLNHRRGDKNYHELGDESSLLDIPYASDHVKTLIEAAAELAGWR